MTDIAQFLSYCSKETPSAHGLRVAELLDRWQGLSHIDNGALEKAKWSSERYIEIWTSRTLSTYDFDELTRLVFLAHDMCIRVEIRNHGPNRLKLMFHPRKREGNIAERHPTLEQAVAKWRERNPIEAEPTTKPTGAGGGE